MIQGSKGLHSHARQRRSTMCSQMLLMMIIIKNRNKRIRITIMKNSYNNSSNQHDNK